MESQEKQPLLNINDMAKLLGVSVQGLRKWEKQGVVTPYRLPGGERRYDPDLTKKQLFGRS